MKTTVLASLLILLVAGCAAETTEPVEVTPDAGPALQLEVFTSSPNGFSVTSTLVYGDDELVLIDPQFLLSEAAIVADQIRETGRTLTTIYTTHAHPDHFFGVAHLLEEFPDARYVALPSVAERMVTSWPARQEFWVTTYGDDLPSADAILPEPLETPQLMLEGEVLEITGPVEGDGPGNTFVHIPSLNAVVAGDIIFNQSHFGPPADTTLLYETLDQIAALDSEVLVAGHQAVGTPNDPAAIDFMRNYISDFQEFGASSNSAEELIAAMLEEYPGMALETLLEGAAGRAFPE